MVIASSDVAKGYFTSVAYEQWSLKMTIVTHSNPCRTITGRPLGATQAIVQTYAISGHSAAISRAG